MKANSLVFLICILVSGSTFAAEPAANTAPQGSWWNPRNWQQKINQRYFEPERMEQADYYAAINAGAQDRARYLQSLQRPPTMRDLYLQAGTAPTDIYERAQRVPGELLRERQEAQRLAPILQQRLNVIRQPGGLTFAQSRGILANRWQEWRGAKSPFMAKTHSYANWENNSAKKEAERIVLEAFFARNPDGISTQYKMLVTRNKDGSYRVQIDSDKYPVSGADADFKEANYRKEASHQIDLTIENDGNLHSKSLRYYFKPGMDVRPADDHRLSTKQQAEFVRELLWRAQDNDAPLSAGHNLPKSALFALDAALKELSKNVQSSSHETAAEKMPQATQKAPQIVTKEPGDAFVEEMLGREIERTKQELLAPLEKVEQMPVAQLTPERIASLRADVEALRVHGAEYAKLVAEAAEKAHSNPLATERLIGIWNFWIGRRAEELTTMIDCAAEARERYDKRNNNLSSPRAV